MDNLLGYFAKLIEHLTLLDFLMSKTLGISLLIVIMLVVRPLLRKFFSAQVSYRLWLILPLFLILPLNTLDISIQSGMFTIVPNIHSVLTTSVQQLPVNKLSLELLICAMWVAGVLILFSIYLLNYRKLKHSLRLYDYQMPGNIECPGINIVNTKLIDVPAVFGLFQPILILPENFHTLSENNQSLILLHECYHLSRHDHHLNFFRILFKIIFWFNPLVYLADKLIEMDQEVSCDSGLIKKSDSEFKKQYIKAIIETVEGQQTNYLLSQWNYQSLIKERIKMIKQSNKRKMHGWIVAFFALSSIWIINGVVAKEKGNEFIKELIPYNVIPAKYPEKALKMGVGGFVRFKMNVNEDGSPYDIKIVASEPVGLFDEASLEAVKKWIFKPELKNGKPIKQVDGYYTMKFVITHEI